MYVGGKSYISVPKVKRNKTTTIAEGYPADWDEKRRKACKIAKGTCSYCFEKGLTLHTHHMIPLSKGGSNELNNLVCICIKCHSVLHPHNSKLYIEYIQEISDKFALLSKYGILCDHLMNIGSKDTHFENNEGFDMYEDNIIIK